MKNKVIIIISLLLVSITIIVFLLTNKNESISDSTIKGNVMSLPIGLYEENGSIKDKDGNDVTDNPDNLNNILQYKVGCEFRPTEKWYTELSCSPINEQEIAKVLESKIKGYVKYQAYLLSDGDDYMYSPISSVYGTSDLLFSIYTEDAEYKACRIYDTVYYYNVSDEIVQSIPIN